MSATKVLHVVDNYRNLDAQYFAHIAERASPEFPPSFAALGEDGPFSFSRWAQRRPVYPLGGSQSTKFLSALLPLARAIRRSGADIVHAHFFFPTLIGLMASRLAGAPFVFTRHHSDHNSRLGKPFHVAIDRWCGRLSDRAIAVSNATRDCMIADGVPSSKIQVIYNGTDGLPRPEPESVATVRKELSLPESARILIMVARLHEEKGHATLFDALKALECSVPDVWVLLAGDGPARKDIEDQVARQDLRVRILGRRGDVARLMAASDVLVLPSRAESFGYVLVEAMLLGLPIVASRCGGVIEIVQDGVSGLTFEIDDSRGLARCLERVLTDETLRGRLASEGRHRAKEFSFERMIRGYEDLYRDVVTRPAGRQVQSGA